MYNCTILHLLKITSLTYVCHDITCNVEIDVARCANDAVGIGRAYSNLGITHGTLKNYQRAVECHSKALSAANGIQDRSAAARAHSNLGISYSMLKVSEHVPTSRL